jgi:hypothetical protein
MLRRATPPSTPTAEPVTLGYMEGEGMSPEFRFQGNEDLLE